MNKKQKMIRKMWCNYLHNCNIHNVAPRYSYRMFRWAYNKESFDYIYGVKEWYKETRI